MQARVEDEPIHMADTPSDSAPPDAPMLSQVLKAIRRRRGLRPVEVAARMGVAKRSYERFESGRGPLNVPQIHRFAEGCLGRGFDDVGFHEFERLHGSYQHSTKCPKFRYFCAGGTG